MSDDAPVSDEIYAYLESYLWGIDALCYWREHLARGRPISLRQAVNEVTRIWLCDGHVDALIGLLKLYCHDCMWVPHPETTRFLVAMLAMSPVVAFGLATKRRDGKSGPHERSGIAAVSRLRAILATGSWTPSVASNLMDMLSGDARTPYFLKPERTTKKGRGRPTGTEDPNVAVRNHLFRQNALHLKAEGQNPMQIVDTLHDMLSVKIDKEGVRKALAPRKKQKTH